MLEKQILEKIKTFDNDFVDLVIKYDEYIEREIPYSNEFVYTNINDLKDVLNEDSMHIIFCNKELNLNNSYFVKNISSDTVYLDETLYYSGKNYKHKLNKYKIEASLLEKLPQYERIDFVFDIEAISSFPIWETKMHRKIVRVLEEINNLTEEAITEERISEIIQKNELKEIKSERQYDIDLIIKYVIELSKNKIASVLFLSEKLGSREKFLIGELRKLVYAAGLEISKRNEYIYSTTYKDMNEMFSKFGFCNFKGNKCLSQRNKSLTNRYPVPKTDGCCFKIFNKCNYNNKDGTCKIECLACKIFTCPYLSNLGVGLRISELLLMRAFMNQKQKRLLIYKFYKPKEFFMKRMS